MQNTDIRAAVEEISNKSSVRAIRRIAALGRKGVCRSLPRRGKMVAMMNVRDVSLDHTEKARAEKKLDLLVFSKVQYCVEFIDIEV